MVSKKTEGQIKLILDDLQEAVGLSLIVASEDVTRSTLELISEMQRTPYTKAFVDGVTESQVKDYTAGVKRGGSWCVEPVYEDIGGGSVKASTRRVFVTWLDDMNKEHTEEILKIFAEGEKAGVYPLDQAKMIEEYFDGTRHRAQTAARTESQKIAQDARIEGYKKSNVKYVQYITAQDEKVRPEHEARDMKVYPVNKAPEIGEYNCRCILTEADFLVEEEGYSVEKDDSVIISKEALGLG